EISSSWEKEGSDRHERDGRCCDVYPQEGHSTLIAVHHALQVALQIIITCAILVTPGDVEDPEAPKQGEPHPTPTGTTASLLTRFHSPGRAVRLEAVCRNDIVPYCACVGRRRLFYALLCNTPESRHLGPHLLLILRSSRADR